MQMTATGLDETDPANVRMTYARTLQEANNLCADVRYATQPEPGVCSGTLIDSRHILTAGHCMDDAGDCEAAWPWVFSYAYTAPGSLQTLTSNDIYRCARIVSIRVEAEVDYAVVELDREVVGHMPAAVRATSVGATRGASVTLMGYPNGIPLKIDPNGHVLAATRDSFRADVDAFSANSGSGGFNEAGELIGILNSGAEDWTPRGSCNVINVVPPVFGEGFSDILPALEGYCATPGVSSPVCACSGMPCVTQVDAGAPDAYFAPDAGAQSDASAASAPDAALAATPNGGCSVSAGNHSERGAAWLLIVAAFVLWRRRSR